MADYAPLRRLAAEILQVYGYHIEEVDSGVAALAAFHRLRPDLLLTTNLMPEMTGRQLAGRVRCHAPNLPIVMMTGDEALLTAPGPPPAVDYLLAKPFSPEQLCAVVAQALRAQPLG